MHGCVGWIAPVLLVVSISDRNCLRHPTILILPLKEAALGFTVAIRTANIVSPTRTVCRDYFFSP